MRALRPWLDRFYRLLMAGSALAMVAAFAAVLLGVADRQFAWGLRGLDAYAGYAIAAGLFLALPRTLQRGEHLRVTLLLQRLPARGRALLEGACLAAGLLLSAALAVYAARLVGVSWATHDISPGSDATPLWMPQLSMALGCVGLAIAFADACACRLLGLPFHPDAAAQSAARSE